MTKQTVDWKKLLICIVAIELIGNIGSLATFSQITTWYATLTKPEFNPPNSVFGPVWILLYALMGVSLYLILTANDEKGKIAALVAFAVQLVLNVLWSFIFFSWHQLGLAFIEIVLMWLAILVTIVLFARISKAAAWLLLPYIGWVTFASVLNYAIWRLN